MKILGIVSLAAVITLSVGSAAAQNYPAAKPIKIIVSTSPGGVTDLAARILGQHITAKTGQTVVIDNRAGASGNIAMDGLAKSEPRRLHARRRQYRQYRDQSVSLSGHAL